MMLILNIVNIEDNAVCGMWEGAGWIRSSISILLKTKKMLSRSIVADDIHRSFFLVYTPSNHSSDDQNEYER